MIKRRTDPGASGQTLGRVRTLFRDIMLKSRSMARRRLGTFGLTFTEMLVLLSVMRGEGVTAGDVAQDLGVAPATVSRLLDRLEKGGYLRRSLHRVDRRRTIVRLGPRGRSIEKSVEAFWEGMGREMFEGFSGNDLAHLERSLDRVNENVLRVWSQEVEP